jgi:hypothetical protein
MREVAQGLFEASGSAIIGFNLDTMLGALKDPYVQVKDKSDAAYLDMLDNVVYQVLRELRVKIDKFLSTQQEAWWGKDITDEDWKKVSPFVLPDPKPVEAEVVELPLPDAVNTWRGGQRG